jgi:hypothetical protein
MIAAVQGQEVVDLDEVRRAAAVGDHFLVDLEEGVAVEGPCFEPLLTVIEDRNGLLGIRGMSRATDVPTSSGDNI